MHCFEPPCGPPRMGGICLPIARVSPGLGTPRSPPTPLSGVRGHVGVRLRVPPKVIQESSHCEPFTGLNCEAGRRSVNAGAADHSAGDGAAPLMGQATPGSTVLVTGSHKGAQEDANQDEWRFFPSPSLSWAHSTLISAFHLLWPRQPLHRQAPPLGPDNV